MNPSDNKPYFPFLTGLRAVAALLVYIHHFPLPEQKVGSFLYSFQSELYIGVTIFFILSGFLITIRYNEAQINYKKYIVNRAARIYPMYFLLTILTFIYYYYHPNDKNASYATGNNIPFTFLMNITFLKGFYDKLKFTGIAQGWTLTVEECFYFLAPLIFILMRKIKWVWIMGFLYIIGILLVLVPKGKNHYGFFDSFQFMFITTFFGRCFDFFVGIQLALWYKNKTKIEKDKRSYYTFTGVISIILTVILLMLTVSKTAKYPFGLYSDTGIWLHGLLLPVCIGIFFWGLLTENTYLKKILQTKVLDILGKSSYTFYLIHMGVIADLLLLITKKYVFHLPALIILSIILFKVIEEPLNKYIRKSYL